MKRIRKLGAPTRGLARYIKKTGAGATWERFRRNRNYYRELVETLTDLQHGLCGYCEIDLRKDDRQIEHVIPRNDPQHGDARKLDPTNLIACCLGGTKKATDPERFLQPSKQNTSCGQAKDERTDPDFIDPRTLPALPSLTWVSYDGRIKADQNACKEAGFSVNAVEKTIDILCLNAERLRLAREKRWRALNANWKQYFGSPQVMEAAARGELLPDQKDRLPRFFTTSRSFFGRHAERVLKQQPQVCWVRRLIHKIFKIFRRERVLGQQPQAWI